MGLYMIRLSGVLNELKFLFPQVSLCLHSSMYNVKSFLLHYSFLPAMKIQVAVSIFRAKLEAIWCSKVGNLPHLYVISQSRRPHI